MEVKGGPELRGLRSCKQLQQLGASDAPAGQVRLLASVEERSVYFFMFVAIIQSRDVIQ
jgi:hypothetical protein